MRWIFSIIVLLVSHLNMRAQVPQRINYQAIVTKPDGSILASSPVGYKFEILDGSISGPVVYSETHAPNTNASGMIGLKIGGGTVVSGVFSSLDWQHKSYFVRISVDVNGGTNYQFVDASQFLSVPYAFRSNTTDSVVGGAQADYNKLTNKPANLDEDKNDDLTLSGNQTISGNKNFTSAVVVPQPVNAGDAATKAYIQTLENAVNALQSAIDTLGIGEYVIDFDGNVYQPVAIGNQVWLNKDLMTTHFMNGDEIQLMDSLQEYLSVANHLSKSFDFFAYKDFNIANKGLKANSYSKNIPLDNRNVCPLGYGVPTEAEFLELLNYVKSTTADNTFPLSKMEPVSALQFGDTSFELQLGMYIVNRSVFTLAKYRYNLSTPNSNGINGTKSLNLLSTNSFVVSSTGFNEVESLLPIRCIKK